ncbi:MAG: hypothetical protein IPG02_14700 [Ignavibacteria bacterium]|nr:hypothetical protein [Ignavibacteria bacterium]
MKKKLKIFSNLILMLAIFVAVCSVSFAQKTKSIEPNTLVKLNGFTVTSPSDDDWEYVISKDKGTVNFILESSNILTGSVNKTFISVFKDSILIETESSRKQLAENLLEEDLRAFKNAGFENLKMNGKRHFDTTIAGRRYYGIIFSCKFTLPDWHVWTYYESVSFIFFPGDSTSVKQYFGFNISSSYNQPLGVIKTNSAELKPIFSLMKSFKYDEAAVQKRSE